ncbi:MAG: PAS domain-containing protein [Chloroflexi bacterium]|nr:MAG: PAS domain-containing protein [Chloroflexota bacterium]
MEIYFLATVLFATASLVLAAGSDADIRRGLRILPLYLLVVARLLALILALTVYTPDRPGTVGGLGALEVFSVFCIAWALLETGRQGDESRSKLVAAGAGAAVLLSVLPLIPGWPVPWLIHSLAVAVFGPVVLSISLGTVHWETATPLLVIALSNFMALFGLVSLSWFVGLFAYALLVYAVHRRTINRARQIYAARQEAAESLAEEAVALGQEHQRWLEASKTIGDVSNFDYALDHIVRTMARFVQVDQAAMVVLDPRQEGVARLSTFYSPDRPVHFSVDDAVEFALDECPPLKTAIESRTQSMLYPQFDGLNKLYSLWYEERVGPTLVQPLSIHGQPVGALILGNPISRRAINEKDVRLCSALAGQIAAIVEYRRRYQALKHDFDALAAKIRQAAGNGDLPVSGPVPVLLASGDHPDEAEVYREILQAINDGVVMSDRLGRIRWVNRAAENILGFSAVELIGQPIARVYGAINSREPIEDLMVAFSRRNQPLPTFIETEERAIQGQLIPWRNVQREWQGIIAVFRDVTREVKVDQSRNDFIAALTRELRSPLTTIKGYSELILHGMMEQYTPEQLRVQQIIHSSAERMEHVLDNALKITVQNREQLLPRFEDVDVSRVVREALRGVSSLAELRELKLHSEVQADLPPVSADPRHLRRILDNLLSNACRFTPPGGQVTVRAWVSEERVGNSFVPRLQIAVADTGIGIPPSETKRIFDPFYKLSAPEVADEADGGMGMGLTVARELVQLHQGRIWVDSVPGKGSVFNVLLPITQKF